jgi:hypothetical protein
MFPIGVFKRSVKVGNTTLKLAPGCRLVCLTAVQGCHHVATASSSCAKAQDTYGELNCVDDKGSPCSGACLQLLVLG